MTLILPLLHPNLVLAGRAIRQAQGRLPASAETTAGEHGASSVNPGRILLTLRGAIISLAELGQSWATKDSKQKEPQKTPI